MQETSLTTTSHLLNDSPPYPHPEAHLGGTPTPLPDTPPTILFLILFTLALLLTILFDNLDRTLSTSQAKPRRPNLLPSLQTAFLLTRLASLATRLAWTYNQQSIRLEIASTTLTSAATILLLITNLIVARRFLRDYALFGLHTSVLRLTRVIAFCAVVSLVMSVSVHVSVYFTRDEVALEECRVIGLVAWCIRVVVAVLPVVAVVVGGWVLPCQREIGRDSRRFWGRGVMVCTVGALLTIEEGFRTGVAFEGRGPGSRAWFLHKACYYCFVLLVEVVIVYGLLAMGLDLRFIMRRRGLGKRDGGGDRQDKVTWYRRFRHHINSEAEVFGTSG